MRIRLNKGLQATLMLFIIAAAAFTANSQTSGELRKKYGEPVYLRLKGEQPEVERYIVRKGIALTAIYDEAGKMCEWLIEPVESANVASDDSERLMPTQVVTSIINELIPKGVRGERISAFNVNGGDPKLKLHHPGCTGYYSARYEHVTIDIVSWCEGGTYSATIHWGVTQCAGQRMQINEIQPANSRLEY